MRNTILTIGLPEENDLVVGHQYRFKFAGKLYSGVCTFSGYRDVFVYDSRGKRISKRRKQADFKECVPVED